MHDRWRIWYLDGHEPAIPPVITHADIEEIAKAKEPVECRQDDLQTLRR